MPRKPLDHVSVGEILPTDIATWNPMIDAGRLARQKKPGGDSPAGTSAIPALLVYVRNDTGASLNVFSVVKLGTPIISASTAPHEARRTPCFPGTTPSAATDPFAILIEPLASGSTGRAIVTGVAVCDVDVNDNAHGYATPGTTASVLESATSGPAKIIWKAGSSGTQRAVVLLQGDMGESGAGADTYVGDVIGPDWSYTGAVTLFSDPSGRVIHAAPALVYDESQAYLGGQAVYRRLRLQSAPAPTGGHAQGESRPPTMEFAAYQRYVVNDSLYIDGEVNTTRIGYYLLGSASHYHSLVGYFSPAGAMAGLRESIVLDGADGDITTYVSGGNVVRRVTDVQIWQAHYAADGTAGISGTFTVKDGSGTNQTVTVEDGIITGWTT